MTQSERELLDVLIDVTDHLAAVMGGPMISQLITFEDGVEGVPTIKRARDVIARVTNAPFSSRPPDHGEQ